VPTPAQLLSDAAAAIVTATGGTPLGSDYRDDLEKIPAGATRFALRGGPSAVDAGDSNVEYVVEAVELIVRHRLASPTAERAYTEGAMQTWLASVIDADFWRGLASAHEVLTVPSYEVAREGALVVVTVRTDVSVRPG